jgi:hypothetical protein
MKLEEFTFCEINLPDQDTEKGPGEVQIATTLVATTGKRIIIFDVIGGRLE